MSSARSGQPDDKHSHEPFLKVCGIRDEQTAAQLAGLPIDAVGLVFAPSRRQVTAAQASRIAAALQAACAQSGAPLPQLAGVFVNADLQQLETIMAVLKLDIIQLHGQEPPAFCAAVKARFGVATAVWKALPVVAGEAAADAAERIAPYAQAADAVLLDTAGGGTGQTFEWKELEVFQAVLEAAQTPLLVAGGLNPDNVGALLAQYAPDGVDVSSGVETDGIKDMAKIRLFTERVKGDATGTG